MNVYIQTIYSRSPTGDPWAKSGQTIRSTTGFKDCELIMKKKLYLKINLIIILQFYILVFFSTRKAVADFLTYYCSSPKPLNADNVGYTVTFIIAFVTQATKMCKLIAAVFFFKTYLMLRFSDYSGGSSFVIEVVIPC